MTLSRRATTIALAATHLFLLSSCASVSDHGKAWSGITPRDEIRVIAQVCLPDFKVSFEDVEVDLTGIPEAKTLHEERTANGYFEIGNDHVTLPITKPELEPNHVTVRRWVPGSGEHELKRSVIGFGEVLDRDGVLSAGSGTIGLWGQSEKNQPIYENEGHRLNDTIAYSISLDVNNRLTTYWYKPPKEIPVDKFSAWQEPISQEPAADHIGSKMPTFWNLTHKKEMEIHPVTGNAPKIRYRLVSVEEYYDQYRFWKRAQKAVGEKYYRGVVGEERGKRHFVPRILGTMSGC